MELQLVKKHPEGTYGFLENWHHSFERFEVFLAAVPDQIDGVV